MEHNMSLMFLTIFEGKDRWKAILISIFLPYLTSYIKYFWSKIYNFLFCKSKYTIILSVKVDKDGKPINSNPNYSSVCWYLESFTDLDIKQLSCEEHQIKTNEKIESKNKRVPIFSPLSSVEIYYNGIKIHFSFRISERSKDIVLSSSNMKILKQFIEESDDKFLKHFYSTLDANEVYLWQWKMNRQDSGDFVYKKIGVNKNFSNIYLGKDTINRIKQDIETFLKQKEYYKLKGIPYKRGYLLYGPPGTGKNSLVYAVSREYKMNIVKIDFKLQPEIVKSAIQKIPPNSILFIDEIDMLIYNDRMQNNNEKKTDKFPLSVLMNILDGYDYLQDCLVFCTTNNKETLDPSLIRPGRIDMHFLLDKLDSEDIIKTVKSFTDFDVEVPKDLTMTSSVLINQILLPNNGDKQKIQELLCGNVY